MLTKYKAYEKRNKRDNINNIFANVCMHNKKMVIEIKRLPKGGSENKFFYSLMW